MALLNNAPSAIYLSIVMGKIARRVKEPTATSKPRTLDDGKVIHEEYYDTLQGFITDIATKDGNYGKQLLITVTNEGDKAVLQMPFSSGTASSFLKALPNVVPDQEVTLRAKMDNDGEKKKTTLFISQNGNGVKWAFTKDNPGDLPPMKKIKVKGKDTWDDSEQLDYFENTIIPAFVSCLAMANKLAEAVTATADSEEEAPF